MLKLIKVVVVAVVAVPIVAVVAFVAYVYVDLKVREMLGITYADQDIETAHRYFRAGNDRMAALWYHKAAKKGGTAAHASQWLLGSMYITGYDGVPQDYVRAYMWLNLAATNGYEPGAETRDEVAILMTQAQIVEAQRLARNCFNSNYRDCE